MTAERRHIVRVRRGGWRVRADRVDALAHLAVASIGEAPAVRVDVEVSRWRPPVPGWLGRLRLPGAVSSQVEPTRGGVRVRLEFAAAVDPGLALGAVVRLLRPTAPLDAPAELTVAPGLPSQSGVIAGWLRDVLLPDEQRDGHVRRCDTLVCSQEPSEATDPERTRTVVVEPMRWRAGDVDFAVSVDPAVHRPIGRRSTGPWAVADAAGPEGSVQVATPDGVVDLGADLDENAVRALRSVGAVVGDALTARIAEQLNACGVLTATTSGAVPDADDALAWQAASVQARRHALRAHGPWAALDAWPSVSVILVTHRPEQLDHAMAQVAALAYPRLEVILGMHGDRFDAARVDALVASVPHTVRTVAIDAGQTLGGALQRCSDRAGGALITKMDDDDHYGSEHIWDLVLARAYSGAQVVGKALDWIHLEHEDVTVFRPTYAAEKYAAFVAGGTMLISRADLAAVGGWRPVPKSVDRALLDRVLADGGLVYRTHGLGYVYVRRVGDRTAAVRDAHFHTKATSTYPGLLRDRALGTA